MGLSFEVSILPQNFADDKNLLDFKKTKEMSGRKFPSGLSHPTPSQLLQPHDGAGGGKSPQGGGGAGLALPTLFPGLQPKPIPGPAAQAGWPFAMTCYDCS